MRRAGIGVTISAAILAAGLFPSLASAQAGAIGAAVAVGGGVDNAHVGAPVLTEHAGTLAEGTWALSLHGGYTSGGIGIGTTSVDFTFIQSVVGAFYGFTDDLTFGAILFPYNSVSFDVSDGTESVSESGSAIGDLALYGKYRLSESADGRTAFAAIAQVQLPTAGDADVGGLMVPMGLEGVALGLGGAVSHRQDNSSFHASALLAVPTDDADGDPSVNLGAAGVFGLSDRIGVSGEAVVGIGDETAFEVGPGIRIQASDNVFLDAAALFLVGTSSDADPYDWGLAFGVNIGG